METETRRPLFPQLPRGSVRLSVRPTRTHPQKSFRARLLRHERVEYFTPYCPKDSSSSVHPDNNSNSPRYPTQFRKIDAQSPITHRSLALDPFGVVKSSKHLPYRPRVRQLSDFRSGEEIPLEQQRIVHCPHTKDQNIRPHDSAQHFLDLRKPYHLLARTFIRKYERTIQAEHTSLPAACQVPAKLRCVVRSWHRIDVSHPRGNPQVRNRLHGLHLLHKRLHGASAGKHDK